MRHRAPGVQVHFPLLSDVPRAVQRSLTEATAVWLSERGVIESAERHVTPETALVRAAMDGWLAVQDLPWSPWPSVAAALLEPSVLRDLGAGLVPSDRPRLLALSEQLAEPAASLCRALAEEQDSA